MLAREQQVLCVRLVSVYPPTPQQENDDGRPDAMLRSLTSTPQHLLRAPPQLGVGPPAQYFTEQKRDHFDPSSSRTWSQARSDVQTEPDMAGQCRPSG